MFKRGVITDEISQEFDEALELAQKYKLDGIEIRSVWEKGPHELDNGEIAKIKECLGDTDLEVCGISAPFFKCDIDDEAEIIEHIEILRKSINLGQKLNTQLIRGFTFWKKGDFEDNLDKIVGRFEKPLKILEEEDMTLVLEFDPSVFAANARTLTQVIKKINSPYVKALWDPGNDIYDPDGEVPYPDGYEMVKPYLAHVHLKDAVRLLDGKIDGVPIGKGQVDYKGQLKALLDDGYKGYVVLETHYRPKHELDESLMKLPKGSAFSYMGYEASEECLINWDRLMEEIR